MAVEVRVLKELLRSRGCVGSAELASRLGLTELAVRSAVELLRRRGFAIELLGGGGYRLALGGGLDVAGSYVGGLGTRVSYKAYYVRTCTSTQDVARELATRGAGEGAVVIAEVMTSGRGRLGRRWVAGEGGLWLTILLRPRRLRNLQLLGLGAGLAVARAVNDLYGVGARVKWPNDVVVRGRKLCGVLAEGCARGGEALYVLLGIGINVNNDLPRELRDVAVSIKELVNRPVPRLPLLLMLLINIDEVYSELASGRCREVLAGWRELSSTIGRHVKVYTPSGSLRG